jgi:protein ImuB
MRLTALDEAAEAIGLKKNQGVAEARAICPMLDVIEEDLGADRRLLDGIADWCDRYTPLVALDGRDGLFLDITGCAHLFGGEKELLKDILSLLFQMGIDARGAISPAPGLS